MPRRYQIINIKLMIGNEHTFEKIVDKGRKTPF
jgi:hypothetical protein